MDAKIILFYFALAGGLVAGENPRVKVSIETNFGENDALKSDPFDTEMLNCGRVMDETIPIGKFPWFAEIYSSKFTGMSIKCGGSLITRDLILTSAACLKTKADMNHPENFVVFMGKSFFLSFKGPIQMRTVRRLIVHPKFNAENHFADLALLRLSEPVDLNQFVNLVCIGNTVKRLSGIVPGFDFKENYYTGKELSSVRVNIVDSKNCTLKHRKAALSIDASRTSLFCTTYEVKTTCKGDEGSGFYFPVGGKWFIGGVTSIGASLQEEVVCDEDHHVGFTNIAPFIDWIQSYM